MKNLLKILFVLVLVFAGYNTVKAAAYNCAYDATHKCVDLQGYAWGADNTPFGGVGWINFNNTTSGSNTSTGTDYKVTFDRWTKFLTGYAYSERYGYIKFGSFGNTYPNSNGCNIPSDAVDDGNCNAQISEVNGSYYLIGYARFCFVYQSGCSGAVRPDNELGGYDGWIAFKGTNVGVTYNTSNGGTFNGFAWGGGSASKSNSNYGSGAGWINVSPSGGPGGVKCDTIAPIDCLDDNNKPIITITTSTNPVKSSDIVVLNWNVSNIYSGCSAFKASATPANSAWTNGVASTLPSSSNGIKTGGVNVGNLSQTTTFSLSCTGDGNIGNTSLTVEVQTFTPIVTITNKSSIATATYGSDIGINYSVSNIPFGCSIAKIYANGIDTGTSITVNSTNTTATGSKTISNITQTTEWEFRCTDTTAPTPNRVGSDKTTTTVNVPNPNVTFSVKDKNTTSKTIIPCTNNGVKITYNIGAGTVKTGTCYATINMSGSDPDWGSGTGIYEDGQTVDIETGQVTQSGNMIYRLHCQKVNGLPWTLGQQLTHSCAAGSLDVVDLDTDHCYEPGEIIDINYTGSNLVSGSCAKSWITGSANKINSSSFNEHYTPRAITGMVGNSYTFGVSSCKQSSDPNGTSLAKDVTIEVKATNACNPPSPGPCTINNFYADSSSVLLGGSTMLNLSTTDCTSASIVGLGVVPINGSLSSGPITSNKTFTLNASDGTNNPSATTTVNIGITSSCVINNFYPTTSLLTTAGPATLNYSLSGCISANINTLGSVTTASGNQSKVTGTLSGSLTGIVYNYTLNALDGVTTVTASTSVTVKTNTTTTSPTTSSTTRGPCPPSGSLSRNCLPQNSTSGIKYKEF